MCPCGSLVDSAGVHGLSCRISAGRSARHHQINDFVYRSLSRANFPAKRKPARLLKADCKRPDGITLIPWREGKCLAWDATVGDTFAPTYLSATSVKAGSAADHLASKKTNQVRWSPPQFLLLSDRGRNDGPNRRWRGRVTNVNRTLHNWEHRWPKRKFVFVSTPLNHYSERKRGCLQMHFYNPRYRCHLRRSHSRFLLMWFILREHSTEGQKNIYIYMNGSRTLFPRTISPCPLDNIPLDKIPLDSTPNPNPNPKP